MADEIYPLSPARPAQENVHPDQKYIQALLNNDTILLKELYQRYSAKIRRMVVQNNGTENDAADIFQEALLAIYYKAQAKSFQLTCPLDAFLYVICRNKWISELQKRKNHRILFTDTEKYDQIGDDSQKVSEDCLALQARGDLVREKFALLGDKAKRLLLLSWSGKPLEEVARILGVSYGYVRKKKCEYMAKLASLVKGAAGFDSLKG
ncbi:RNA polymerase sigma factor [Paraflavisolibacter sp. H34]|uniref:RNA polymerase sigma factor n=1 Tax=Huijunlia imazamoxiresistens TaxID=3127457 RepID=UPI003016271F